MSDEKTQLAEACARVEAAGANRYGERWKTAIDAIGRAGGVSEANMKAMFQTPDPAKAIYDLGKEALLHQSDNGDHESERLYRLMREDERAAHRKMRGR
jgi:hypothetical protein